MCVKCNRAKGVKKTVKSPCLGLYNKLISLDSTVLRYYSDTKDPNLLLINKQLNSWISNIKNSCPPEDELQDVITIIDNYEYPVNQ